MSGLILVAALALTPIGYDAIEFYQYKAQFMPITAENVFTYDLRQPSDLSGLALTGELAGLEEAIREGQDAGVNGIFLLAVIMHESGYGTSNLARESNNLGGISDGNGGHRRFDRKSACVEYMAGLLATHYLDPEGKWYRGGTVAGVGRVYAGDPDWYKKVGAFMVKIQNELEGLNENRYS